MIDFTTHVTLGDLMTMLSIVGSVITIGYNMWFKLKGLDTRMADMEVELRKQTDILIQLAQQRERLIAIDRRVDDLFSRLNNQK